MPNNVAPQLHLELREREREEAGYEKGEYAS